MIIATPVCGSSVDDLEASPAETLEPCPPFGVVVHVDQSRSDYRCELLTRLINRGLKLGSKTGTQVMTELARPYATTIDISGQTALPRRTLDYLLQNLSDTATLINLYQGTRYQVDYLDLERAHFFATNNRSMQATFHRFQTNVDDHASDYLLFERGRAKMLFWRLHGSTVLEFKLTSRAGITHYQLMIHIFSDSAGYHSFFESRLFRYLIRSLVHGVVDKISMSAAQLAKSNDAIPSVKGEFVQTVRGQLKTAAEGQMPQAPIN